MTGAPLLEVRGLRAGYVKDVEILRGVDLVLNQGELATVVGPNGAGKSTLIKAVFGLLTPSGGSIRLRGEDVTGLNPHAMVARGVGYVPQVRNVFPALTVEENLDIGAYLTLRIKGERKEMLYEWFPLLGERRRSKAGKLSGGQRQLVAIARALMPDPAVLLLDEPSAGLSPANVDEIFHRIEEIYRRGVSLVMVEQNARRALAPADIGYVLDQGTNAYTGVGIDLIHDPKVAHLYLGGA